MKRETAAPIIIGKLMHLGGMLERQGTAMLKPYDLNYQQFAIFFEIGKACEVRQKDVVNRLMLDKAHVSKVVKKLEEMEFLHVSEDAGDRRSRLLTVTDRGRDVLQRCSEMFREWNRGWIGEIDENGLPSILDNLTALQEIFKTHTGQHSDI